MLSCSGVVCSGSSFSCYMDRARGVRVAPGSVGYPLPTLRGVGTPLTLAVSSSCSTSSRLEGFRDDVTHVR